MDKIKTATGKEFDCDYLSAIPYPQQLFFRVLHTAISNAAVVFSNHSETEQLWYGDYYLSQYTKLIAIIPEGDAVKVILAKE